jgi:hypothetical protein
MFEYFGQLYKHANKGIKGRGKDRRISITGMPVASALSLAPSAEALSSMAAAQAPLMDRGYSVHGNASVTSSCCSSPYPQHHEQLAPMGDYKFVVG